MRGGRHDSLGEGGDHGNSHFRQSPDQARPRLTTGAASFQTAERKEKAPERYCRPGLNQSSRLSVMAGVGGAGGVSPIPLQKRDAWALVPEKAPVEGPTPSP